MPKLFNHEFNYLNLSFIEDLYTLEREGAIYAEIYTVETESFELCRILLNPTEIYGFVEASIAYDEFDKNLRINKDPNKALDKISNSVIKARVIDYNNTIGEEDTLFCFAAFMGGDLEELLCGGLPDRYEILKRRYSKDRKFLLDEIFEMFPQAANLLNNRKKGCPPYTLDKEQDVHDLLYAIVKCTFTDSNEEDTTPLHAGGSKRVDIYIPSIFTIIEVKYVRDSNHSKNIADELKIDFESYHAISNLNKLIAYVWDPNKYIKDRYNFTKDLNGLRIKNNHKFLVKVIIKP